MIILTLFHQYYNLKISSFALILPTKTPDKVQRFYGFKIH